MGRKFISKWIFRCLHQISTTGTSCLNKHINICWHIDYKISPSKWEHPITQKETAKNNLTVIFHFVFPSRKHGFQNTTLLHKCERSFVAFNKYKIVNLFKKGDDIKKWNNNHNRVYMVLSSYIHVFKKNKGPWTLKTPSEYM